MADNTKIEWTDATWQIITGCSLMSDGCRYCYAADLAATRLKNLPSRKGLAKRNAAGVAQFDGKVRFNEEWLDQPLKWKRPRRIFVCAHADLFHENVPDDWIDKVFAVMALCPQHTFQVLTKRPERMRKYLAGADARERIVWGVVGQVMQTHAPEWRQESIHGKNRRRAIYVGQFWPLPNVWLGVSIEDQPTADTRIPYLLDTPAAERFVSAEPLLGAVDLTRICWKPPHVAPFGYDALRGGVSPWLDGQSPGETVDPVNPRIDWVIVGGESGRHARPMHPQWARDLRDQCAAAGVAFLFKQWGAWAPHVGALDGWSFDDDPEISRFDHLEYNPATGDWGEPFRPAWCDWDGLDETQVVSRVGKRRSGRMLDGVTHDGFPEGQG